MEIKFPAHYATRPGDLVCARALIAAQERGTMAVALLTGAPGVGKTAFAEALAESLGGRLIYYLAHHWTSDEDLFVRLDPARVAGIAGGIHNNMRDAYRPGALLRAAIASRRAQTVLCLDEWDKAPARADALLLDFLQSGCVRGPYGETWRANARQLMVIVTSNGMRELSEPLLRRCYRYEMTFLPQNIEADVIRKRTGVKPGVCRAVVALLNEIRQAGESSPSLAEAIALAHDIRDVVRGKSELQACIHARLVKASKEIEVVNRYVPVIWGEMKR